MADDNENGAALDRLRVAGGEDYEVQYIADQTGITADQVRELIKAYGNNREKLIQAAKGLGRYATKVRSSRL